MKILKVLSALLVLFSSVLTGCNKNSQLKSIKVSEEKKLIVYTSHKPEIFEPIIKEFQERSGIWVKVVQGGTNELLNQIVENGEYGCADVMFGGGVDNLASYSQYFEPYKTSQYEKLNKAYISADNSYTVFSMLPIVFVYNEKLVLSDGTPKTYKELLTAKWKDKIAFTSPINSGSAYTALATMIQILNKNYSEQEVVKAFVYNLNGDISKDSKDVIDQVISGNKAVGITLEETALKRIKKGAKIGIIYPQDGTSSVPDGSAILKHAPHLENAKLFMEFVVSNDVQHLLEDELSRRSVRTDVSTLNPVIEMNYDLSYAIKSRDKIMKLWTSLTETK